MAWVSANKHCRNTACRLSFNWCLGPKAVDRSLIVDRPGRYLVIVDCMNCLFDSLAVTVSLDDHVVARTCLPNRIDGGSLIDAIVELRQVRNALEFSFDKWHNPNSLEKRPLAMVLQTVHVVPR